MKAPVIFPYFGGKRRVAHLIWQALGHCDNYIEPFFGSGAVLFNRPQDRNPWPPKGETINDLDGYVVNVWRSIQAEPELVAALIESLGPSQELTLHAVNAELIARRDGLTEKLRADRSWYDADMAACWVWGACQWIGRGWATKIEIKRQHLGNWGNGAFSLSNRDDIGGALCWVASRMRHVRILCGDWTRCVTDSAMTCLGSGATQGIMLDPPYIHAMRDKAIYAKEMACADAVAEWCRERGGDERIRIVLCGVAGEHAMGTGWRLVDWKSAGQGTSAGNKQAPERLWLSPHCLPVHGEQPCVEGEPIRRRQKTIFDLVG
jgi:site-specific DNA-adenine methylase